MVVIEEIEDDIDNMDFDPADYDPRGPLIQPVIQPVKPSSGEASRSSTSSPAPSTSRVNPQSFSSIQTKAGEVPLLREQDMEEFKDWNVIYPLYFDKRRTRAEGRRVSEKLAVDNPLAETLMHACRELRIRTVYEAHKTHPKDWANPGRIRVELKENEFGSTEKISNKRHLYILLSEYLKKHPTTDRTPYESSLFQQMAAQQAQSGYKPPENTKPLAVPTGWKVGDVLPFNSRALSGGKADEEMMNQLQGQMFPGLNAPDIKPKKMKVRMGR
jgi:signal recognition particle subunit SRP19